MKQPKLFVYTFLFALVFTTGNCKAMENMGGETVYPHDMAKPSGNIDASSTQITRNSMFQIEMILPANGFKVGFNTLKLSVKTPNGGLITGAHVNIKPWMPGMGHGVTVEPLIKEEGGGIYGAEKVGFSMPGHWQLIVTITKSGKADAATFEFPDIQGGESHTGSNHYKY